MRLLFCISLAAFARLLHKQNTTAILDIYVKSFPVTVITSLFIAKLPSDTIRQVKQLPSDNDT